MDKAADPMPPLCLHLCAVMLQYFQTARPGFRMAQMGLQEYSTNDIRRTFNQLRRLQWLEAAVSFDAEGNRYSGLVVSLTPLGHAAVRALLAEPTSSTSAACQFRVPLWRKGSHPARLIWTQDGGRPGQGWAAEGDQ